MGYGIKLMLYPGVCFMGGYVGCAAIELQFFLNRLARYIISHHAHGLINICITSLCRILYYLHPHIQHKPVLLHKAHKKRPVHLHCAT